MNELHALADFLTDLLAGHACRPDRITVSAGEPAAPQGENCRAVWIWADSLVNGNTDPSLTSRICHVRTIAEVRVRLDVCYPLPDEGDPSDEDYAAGADCLHDWMLTIWCALLPAQAEAFGVRDCNQVNIDRWQVNEPSGGMMSVVLSAQVAIDCPTVEVS